MDLKGKRILVTGANGGIGSALCSALSAEGADLVLCSFQPDKLEAQVKALAAKVAGGTIHTIQADISSIQDRARVVSECDSFGGIDVLVNLAGILDFSLFEDQAPGIIEQIININLLAPILLCQSFLVQLKSRPESMILNVGSIFGSIGHPGFVTYCASKAGVKTFTEALGRELADTNIRVGYIAPRATATALNTDRVNKMNRKLGNRMDTPAYVAERIVGQLKTGRELTYLGWPEKFFVRVNALLPSVVRNALVKNLGVIKQFARS